MRPLLFGTDSTQELRVACERLAPAFTATRSQRARFCYPGTQAPQKAEIPPIPTFEPRRKFSEPSWALAIVALIVLGAIVLLASANFLADNLIKGLRDAEQQRIDKGWKKEFAMRALYAPWIAAHPGQWYTIKWGQHVMRIHSKGTLRKLSELPKEGNQIGDFYNIEDQTHFFVWMIPPGESAPSWVDP